MVTTSRGPGRPRSAEADAGIVAAALDLLIDRGIGAVSVEQVARRAGVTRATVYRRYAERDQLVIAAIKAGHQEPAELPEVADVEEMLSYWAQTLARPRLRQLTRRLMTSMQDHPDFAKAYREASIDQRDRAIAAVLEQARDRGDFPPDTDLAVIQRILTGAVATHLLTYPDSCSAAEIEEYLVHVLRHTTYRSSR